MPRGYQTFLDSVIRQMDSFSKINNKKWQYKISMKCIFFFFFNLTTFGCTCMQRGMRSKLFLFLLVSQLATMTKSPGEEFPFLEAADEVRELGLHSVPRSERLSPSGRGRHVQKKKNTSNDVFFPPYFPQVLVKYSGHLARPCMAGL